MKTYTCGQIQIVRDALELAHDTSDGEDKRKIMGAIYLLDMPLDAFAVVYRLKDEVKDLRDEVVAGDQDIERLTAERDALEKSIKIRDLAFTYAMTCGFGLKREAEELAAENVALRGHLAYAIMEAEGWADDADGIVLDAPEMEAARAAMKGEKK